MYATDNGPHMNSWPDGAMTPFRSEKNTNWEGAFRVPLIVRWPGKIPAGVVSNEIVQHHDWLPTFLAAAGEPDVVEKLKEGHEAAGKTFKVHIDGYNLLPYLTGEEEREPAQGVHLLLGRRRPRRAALRQLEARLHGAAGARHARAVGGAVRPAARPEALQPAHRPVRAGGHDLEHVLGLVPLEGVPDPRRAGDRRRLPRDVQGLPAAPEGRELHDRPGAREDGRPPRAARATDAEPRLLERHGRRREAIVAFAESGGADRARRRSASPSSTTTARSGARSRCRSSSGSSSSGSPRWPRRTRRCVTGSRGRRRTRRTTPGSAA